MSAKETAETAETPEPLVLDSFSPFDTGAICTMTCARTPVRRFLGLIRIDQPERFTIIDLRFGNESLLLGEVAATAINELRLRRRTLDPFEDVTLIVRNDSAEAARFTATLVTKP